MKTTESTNANVNGRMSKTHIETASRRQEDRTDRIAKWICRGLFLLAGLSWAAAAIGAMHSPAVFAAVLTAGVSSMFGMIVTGLLMDGDE